MSERFVKNLRRSMTPRVLKNIQFAAISLSGLMVMFVGYQVNHRRTEELRDNAVSVAASVVEVHEGRRPIEIFVDPHDRASFLMSGRAHRIRNGPITLGLSGGLATNVTLNLLAAFQTWRMQDRLGTATRWTAKAQFLGNTPRVGVHQVRLDFCAHSQQLRTPPMTRWMLSRWDKVLDSDKVVAYAPFAGRSMSAFDEDKTFLLLNGGW